MIGEAEEMQSLKGAQNFTSVVVGIQNTEED